MGENNAGEVFCPQCDLKFDNKSELYIHVSIMHQEDLFPAIEPQMKREKSRSVSDTSLNCSTCGKSYSTKGNILYPDSSHITFE